MFGADHLTRGRVVERCDVHRRAVLPLRFAFVDEQVLPMDVVNASEAFGAPDRPVHRCRGNTERPLEIVEELQRIARGSIELVDERENRQSMAAADLEQLARLILDPIRRVDHHHHTVGGNQRAVRVLAEVLVARRVEQRHPPAFELEFERRRRDRNAALLLERHPVGGRMTPRLAPANGAGQLDCAGIKEQLLGQRRLAGVGVRNDRERASSSDLCFELRYERFLEPARQRGFADLCHFSHCIG